jgi:hypothetical protein
MPCAVRTRPARLRYLQPVSTVCVYVLQLHVRAMGSYLRGKADCGDADVLITPPPACSHLSPGAIMPAILQGLQALHQISSDVRCSSPARTPPGLLDAACQLACYVAHLCPCKAPAKHRLLLAPAVHTAQSLCAPSIS